MKAFVLFINFSFSIFFSVKFFVVSFNNTIFWFIFSFNEFNSNFDSSFNFIILSEIFVFMLLFDSDIAWFVINLNWFNSLSISSNLDFIFMNSLFMLSISISFWFVIFSFRLLSISSFLILFWFTISLIKVFDNLINDSWVFSVSFSLISLFISNISVFCIILFLFERVSLLKLIFV